MQLIGADDVLCFLGNFPVFRRQQFRGDRGIQDVLQHRCRRRTAMPHLIADDVAHQGLGHGAVHAVHGHMVAVIGGPAQGQL